MKIILTLIFLLVCINVGFCQNLSPTRHQVTKLFKSSIDQESKKSISVGNSAWTICNQDSAFFKADTLRLYNNLNYFYQISTCCKFILWTFYKKNAFVLSGMQVCKEPASSSIRTEYYKIRYFGDKKELYMVVLDRKRQPEFFRVIGLQEIGLADNNKSKVIVLKGLISKQRLVGSVH